MNGLERALEDALARPSLAAFVAVHAEIPALSPEAFVRAAGAETSFVFAPPDGPALAAAGVVELVGGVSPGDHLCTAICAPDVEHRSIGRARPGPVRAFAAFPFPDPRRSDDPLEQGFAVLPRWQLASEDSGAILTLLLRRDEAASEADRTRICAEWQRISSHLADGAVTRLPAVSSRHAPSESFLAAVADAVRRFEGGALQKVVLSRRVELELDREVDPTGLLEQLSRESGWGCRVAVQHGGGAFVAVTPERLVRKSGARVETEALAGTADLAKAGSAGLSHDPKELAEHAFVVRHLEQTLRPHCAELEIPASPGTRALRHVLHLHTPVRGRLAAPQHAISLAALLHPTPAVAGTPRPEALEWIRSHESEPRGLYAGLVGWFDAAGDGDFWVGLRGATIRGNRLIQRVGAGLVTGSTPDGELAETEAKERALRRILGAAA